MDKEIKKIHLDLDDLLLPLDNVEDERDYTYIIRKEIFKH